MTLTTSPFNGGRQDLAARSVFALISLVLLLSVVWSMRLWHQHVALALVCMIAAVIAFLADHKAMSERRSRGRNYAVTVVFVVMTMAISALATLWVADRLLGVVLWWHADLIFPENTTVFNETSEFKFTVKINSMGFRDREVTPKVAGKQRIVVIGDSFVYGWGVEIEQAWPKVLEAELNSAGMNVEVFDLGCPGYGPTDYLRVASKAIPALAPDLIIVGVLQGDDLRQERVDATAESAGESKAKSGSLQHRIALFVAPNVVSLLKGEHPLRKTEVISSRIREVNQKEVQEVLAKLTDEQRRRLDAVVDRQAYQMFLDGNLNPAILLSAANVPDYFAFTLQPEQAEVKQAIARMGNCLAGIRQLAERAGAQEMVVSEPFPAYITGAHQKNYGFTTPASALTGTAQDDAIAAACQQAGVKGYFFTEVFRREASHRVLFYKYDGHFTPEGHRLFAELVGQAIFHLAPPTK